MNIIPSRKENSDPHITLAWKEKCVQYNVFNGSMQNTTRSRLRNLCLTMILTAYTILVKLLRLNLTYE